MYPQEPPPGPPGPEQLWPEQPWPPQQPWQPAPPAWQPYQPPRRRGRGLRGALIAIGGVLVVIIAIGALAFHGTGAPAASGSSPAATAAATGGAAAPSAAATAAQPAATAQARTIATFTGSGITNTPRFTVTSTWQLAYSFNCASFGRAGNFAVLEDGGKDVASGVTVNDLAMKKSASSWAYNDAGSHYLQIVSECAWTVKVIDEP